MANIKRNEQTVEQRVKCYNCGYEWITRAKRTIHIRCPNCQKDIKREQAVINK